VVVVVVVVVWCVCLCVHVPCTALTGAQVCTGCLREQVCMFVYV